MLSVCNPPVDSGINPMRIAERLSGFKPHPLSELYGMTFTRRPSMRTGSFHPRAGVIHPEMVKVIPRATEYRGCSVSR